MTKDIKYISGLTITELLITLTVVAIFVSLSTPYYTSLLSDNRLTTQLNMLQTTLSFARSEAIKRNTHITLCRSDTRDACQGRGDWKEGWVVFSDNDVDGTIDAGEVILLRHGPIFHGNTINFNRSRITYYGSGLAKGASNGTFIFCDSRGPGSAKGLIINNIGRARHATDTNTDGIVENGSKKNVICP